MKNQISHIFKRLAMFIVAITLSPVNVRAATAPVVIYKIGIDPTIIAESEYRVWASVRQLGDTNANITSRFYVYADANGDYSDSRVAMPQSKVLFNIAPRADTIVEARIPKSYFKNECIKISVNAYDAGSNEQDSHMTQTVCRAPVVPKALSGRWEWNNGLWVENPTLNVSQVKLGAFLKQDNGANWDYKTKKPQSATLLEIEAKPHDAASANKPYIGEGSLMMTASELESYNAYLMLSSNKCKDYKIRISTADGPTSDSAFTTKITPSPWRLFTAGSECAVPWANTGGNKIQTGKWEWLNGSLEGGIVPPTIHLFGKLSKDDGTVWDLKTTKPLSLTALEVHSRVHTPTSFNQPYSNSYDVTIDAEKVVNGTQIFSLVSTCKDYEIRIKTLDGGTTNPNISNKITPSGWWHFLGGASCTLADTQKPAPAMPPVTPNSTIKPIDSFKPIIRPTTPSTAPNTVNPAVVVPKPIAPAVIVAPKPAADEPINNKKPIRKLNF